MDNEHRNADDLPDRAELSGPLGKAVEQIRREAVPDNALARVLGKARQIPAAVQPSLQNNRPSPRRRSMFTIAIRALAAAGTTAALVAAWLYNQATSSAAADLGTVLTKTAAAQTLKLKVDEAGKSGEVLVEGRKLRRDLPDGTYKIVRDGKAWLIDEKQNRASSEAATYFRSEKDSLDLLALVGLADGNQQKQLMAAQPAERKIVEGRPVEIYRWEAADGDGRIRVDATVDAKTQLLESIERLRIRGERVEPICRLTVIARDKPVNEDLFVVGDTLTEDGRIGKVTDTQGLVTVRPVMHDRWTPVAEHMPLRPGDWLQTIRAGRTRFRSASRRRRNWSSARAAPSSWSRRGSFAFPRARSKSCRRPNRRSNLLVPMARRSPSATSKSIGPTARNLSNSTRNRAGS